MQEVERSPRPQWVHFQSVEALKVARVGISSSSQHSTDRAKCIMLLQKARNRFIHLKEQWALQLESLLHPMVAVL